MKKIAILQSNYIPWKGVFDMMSQVNCFIFFEDVQFTRRDWRTRNRIKTPNGLIWLSIPVKKANRDDTKIYEVEISQEENWQEKHYRAIFQNYKKAKFFDEYHFLIEEIYLKNKWQNLSEFNIFHNKLIANILGIKVDFINSKDLKTDGFKSDKLINICKKVDASHYLSGPSAKAYMDIDKFQKNNIEVEFINYNCYPVYSQLYQNFYHEVSILDVLFNCGNDSKNFIKITNE